MACQKYIYYFQEYDIHKLRALEKIFCRSITMKSDTLENKVIYSNIKATQPEPSTTLYCKQDKSLYIKHC